MRIERAAAAIAVAAALFWVCVGQRFGEQLPFSPLSMFAESASRDRGRIVVRARDGMHELRTFTAFACEGELDFATAGGACARTGVHPEEDALAADWVRARRLAGEGGERIEIVRRIWRAEQRGSPIRESDCVLVACRAERSR
jgi:hypothetical protein